MKKLIPLFFLLAMTGCKLIPKTVLLSGDSWAFFVCSNGSLDQALKNVGIMDAAANLNCLLTTRVGLRAENWLESSAHERTLKALKEKEVKVLYLSLGGNDLMNHWKKSMSIAEERVVFEKIAMDIRSILDIYRAARPDIKILLSGYDFPRFTANHQIDEYREAYEDMESPTPLELNKAVLRFSETVNTVADQKSVFFIHHYGLMHYYLGNRDQGVEPGTTLRPELISSADHPLRFGGDVRAQNDAAAMMSLAGIVDAFHLGKYGFDRVADHAVDIYLKNWLAR